MGARDGLSRHSADICQFALGANNPNLNRAEVWLAGSTDISLVWVPHLSTQHATTLLERFASETLGVTMNRLRRSAFWHHVIAQFTVAFVVASVCFGQGGTQTAVVNQEKVPALVVHDLIDLPLSNVAYRLSKIRTVRNEIYEAARAAEYAYYDAEKLPPGWRRLEINRAKSIFGAGKTIFIIKIDDASKTIQLAVRGTNNFDDAIQDLRISATIDPHLGFPVHSGFSAIARGIYHYLSNDASFARRKMEYRHRLAGHSLGGAAAAILSMYLYQDGLNVDFVGTFGAPRFVTNEGARKFQLLNERTHRIVRCDDVIPFLPPPNFFASSLNRVGCPLLV